MATFYRPLSQGFFPWQSAVTPMTPQYGYQAATHLDAALKRSHEVRFDQLLAEMRDSSGNPIDICTVAAADLVEWFFTPSHAQLRSVTFEVCAYVGWATPLLLSVVRESAPGTPLAADRQIRTTKSTTGAVAGTTLPAGPVSNIGALSGPTIARQTDTFVFDTPVVFGLSERLMFRIDQLPTPSGTAATPTLCPPSNSCCSGPEAPKIKARLTFEVF